MGNRVHFIGIAGSAIAPIAIMMKDLGWDVSGSDENVFEPALSQLSKAKIKWFEGYDPKRVEGVELVIVGGGPLMKDPENPEYTHAKRLGVVVKGYAYVLEKYVVKPTSVVVAGSYGKTTTTSIITWILEKAGKDPSFMIGGKPLDLASGVRSTDSDISSMEGDEFVSVYNMDHEPRFVYYKPTHTVITAAKWDHVNVYPTEQEYVDAYKKLVDRTSQNNGSIYISLDGENNDQVIHYAKEKGVPVITYSMSEERPSADYSARDIELTGNLTKFNVFRNDDLIGTFQTSLIGRHNVENCLAAITVTNELGIKTEDIDKAISSFSGISRRLQILGENSKGALIIDDFAHSAMKAKASIDALKTTFPNKKLIVVYNPRLSAREDKQELEFYPGAFDKADKVILPKIIVKSSTPKENRIYGQDIIRAINRNKETAEYIPKRENILELIGELSSAETVVVFMSASGWDGLMEDALAL